MRSYYIHMYNLVRISLIYFHLIIKCGVLKLERVGIAGIGTETEPIKKKKLKTLDTYFKLNEVKPVQLLYLNYILHTH